MRAAHARFVSNPGDPETPADDAERIYTMLASCQLQQEKDTK